jgi:hypothetical protein
MEFISYFLIDGKGISLHGMGITMGLVHRWHKGRLAIRGAGAVVALSGMFFLWRVFM